MDFINSLSEIWFLVLALVGVVIWLIRQEGQVKVNARMSQKNAQELDEYTRSVEALKIRVDHLEAKSDKYEGYIERNDQRLNEIDKKLEHILTILEEKGK